MGAVTVSGMPFTVRRAVPDDIARIAALTAEHRRRLAGWAPIWWRPSAAADQLHPLWLEHLVRDESAVVRVVEDRNIVVGCGAAVRQPGQWFVDDVALVEDAPWPGAGVALLQAITERPALTCVPHAHAARRRASTEAGLTRVSSYWIRPCDGGEVDVDVGPIPAGVGLPPAPRHTFGGALDPSSDGALAFAAHGGVVVGSPSMTAPPVYDPGGTVAVVDRVAGDDRSALLRTTLTAAAARGDVLVAVVAAHRDEDLEGHLAAAGFDRTVDVFAWRDH